MVLDLETKELTTFPQLPLSTASTGSFADGSSQIIAVTSRDFSETVLYRATRAGASGGIALPGFFINGISR